MQNRQERSATPQSYTATARNTMLAFTIFTLATTTQAKLIFTGDPKLENKPKIDPTKSVAIQRIINFV